MHILFLTDNFPPEVNAPASRTFEHCREWVRAGEQVTVITCAPNFPKGEVFPGYRNLLWQSEVMDGVRVIRVWTYISANEGFLRRILDYVSFMLSATLASFFVRRVDVVIGTSPQFFTVCAAYLTGLFKGRPWIFELRDIWPESIRAVDAMRTSWALDFLEKIELFLYRKADAIVAVTHSFKASLIARGVDGEKINVVTNGVDSTRFKPLKKDATLVRALELEGKFVAGYIGTHGLAHALDTVLDAAKLLALRENGDRFRIILLGDGASKAALQERANVEGIANVLFVDSVSKDEVVKYWSLLDVSIIHLRKTDAFTSVIPSKLFECMGMGIPVLHGVMGESAEIVERTGVGETFEPENADALCDAYIAMYLDQEKYDTARERGPSAAKEFDREMLATRMLEIVRDVAIKVA
jgi:glycosyltransferase involved in cell wall biosynthesis